MSFIEVRRLRASTLWVSEWEEAGALIPGFISKIQKNKMTSCFCSEREIVHKSLGFQESSIWLRPADAVTSAPAHLFLLVSFFGLLFSALCVTTCPIFVLLHLKRSAQKAPEEDKPAQNYSKRELSLQRGLHALAPNSFVSCFVCVCPLSTLSCVP